MAKYEQINNGFKERGAHYCLKIDNKGEALLYKDGNKIKFSARMETL